jgi:hypothetical protein
MTAANSKTGPPCLASRLIVALHLRLIVPRLAPGSRLWLIRDSYAAQTSVLRISAARPGGYCHLAIGDQPGLRLGGHMPMEPVPPPGPGLAGGGPAIRWSTMSWPVTPCRSVTTLTA